MSAQIGDVFVIWLGQVAAGRDTTVLAGVSRLDGKELWRRDLPVDDQSVVAGGLVVIHGRGRGSVQVIDPATGKDRWRMDEPVWATVHQDAVYIQRYADQSNQPKGNPTLVARAVADGRHRWTVADSPFTIKDDTIGAHRPHAPPAAGHLPAVVTTGVSGAKAAVVDAASGRLLGGRADHVGWHVFPVDTTVVVTDHDPPDGESRCTVELVASDRDTGATRWKATVFSARGKEGRCLKFLSRGDERVVIGAGTRVAAVTETGVPQLFDLAGGRTVWVGDTAGVPIDGDGRSLLVRRSVEAGDLTVVDFGTGTARWTLPDPAASGGPGQAGITGIRMTGRFLAVGHHADARRTVRVYDIGTGRQLHQVPGSLVDAGDDWLIASDHSAKDGTVVSLYRI